MVDKVGRNYRYYVKPLTADTNEQIAVRLNALGDSAFSCEHQRIIADDVIVRGVYELPHSMLTEISRTEHLAHVRFYVQEGAGAIRPYKHFTKRLRALGRTNAVKTVARAIRKMK